MLDEEGYRVTQQNITADKDLKTKFITGNVSMPKINNNWEIKEYVENAWRAEVDGCYGK